tara:strand:- start:244 stop:513 length:270 start_codon:yes stop_codon:yes gene_type:complete
MQKVIDVLHKRNDNTYRQTNQKGKSKMIDFTKPAHHSSPVTRYTIQNIIDGAPHNAVHESLLQTYLYRRWFNTQRGVSTRPSSYLNLFV